ncbi:MAG: histidinol dehydrogenase [Micrococcales bacterium]|nr:histidinol dehydrogenase [Micrococcales bacterium]
MIRLIDLRGSNWDASHVIPRAGQTPDDVFDQVVPIVHDVAQRGADAVQEWTKRLDGAVPQSLRVPADVMESAWDELAPRVRDALETAADRVRQVHQLQRPVETAVEVVPEGVIGQRWIPVRRVGLYVPGGRAVYPSSVIMNVIPAQVAGVQSLAVVSPPQADHDGWPHPVILAACRMLGVSEVYAVGGAQAVALLAYGASLPSQSCKPVDLITGPGNVWVTAAKRAVMGQVGIDSEAGPTEVMVVADDSADANVVAADLVSQAEHDPLAAAVLVTDSQRLARAVGEVLAAQVAATKHTERIAAALTGEQSAVVLVEDMDAAVAVANSYGAEHLEIQTIAAEEVAARITNAGAIFIGADSPVSLGDYAAGSNHVLPTSGMSAHSSGLGVHTFLRSVQTIKYSRQALAGIADAVQILADAEDLPAHGAAIAARFNPADGDN